MCIGYNGRMILSFRHVPRHQIKGFTFGRLFPRWLRQVVYMYRMGQINRTVFENG